MNIVQYVNKKSKQARFTGLLMIVLGVLSLISPFAAGVSISIITGVLILVSGLTFLMLAFGAGAVASGLLLGLLGLVGTVAGGYMIINPAAGLALLTLTLAIYFVAGGIAEIIAALQARRLQGWGWFLVSGIISVLLGAMIWGQFPLSGIWAVGVLVGIRLLMAGFVLFAIAGAVKHAVNERA